ncbi:MAG: hypothetical protein AAFV86_11050, partial [Pseudomonadota bacterium]
MEHAQAQQIEVRAGPFHVADADAALALFADEFAEVSVETGEQREGSIGVGDVERASPGLDLLRLRMLHPDMFATNAR